MPEQYKALIVILVLASAVFAFAKAPATAMAMSKQDFIRRRNCWFFITIAGFISPNFWIFSLVLSVCLWRVVKLEENKAALFFFLLFALPQVGVEIPGFVGIRYFLKIDYVKILIIFILLPVCIEARYAVIRSKNKNKRVYFWPDMFLALYLILNIILIAQYDTATGVVRNMLYRFVDVVIPYYALSRSINSVKRFKDVLLCFAVGAMIMSLVGVFEFFKHWLLYSSIASHWGSGDGTGGYLLRGDLLRAIATTGQSIVMGYTMTIAIGFFLYGRRCVPLVAHRGVILALLIAGVLVPLSRGPWVGLALLLFLVLLTGHKRVTNLTRALVLSPLILLFLVSSELGQKIIDHLPFVGTVDAGNVTYRQELFNTSIGIVFQNPFFGSADYLLQMEELRTGLGIIDLVNTYLIVALNGGLVGLGLFCAFFGVILAHLVRSMVQLKSNTDIYALGQILFATLCGVLLIIGTVSPISNVALLFWSVAAMGLAYAAMVRDLKANPLAVLD